MAFEAQAAQQHQQQKPAPGPSPRRSTASARRHFSLDLVSLCAPPRHRSPLCVEASAARRRMSAQETLLDRDLDASPRLRAKSARCRIGVPASAQVSLRTSSWALKAPPGAARNERVCKLAPSRRRTGGNGCVPCVPCHRRQAATPPPSRISLRAKDDRHQARKGRSSKRKLQLQHHTRGCVSRT